MDSKEFIPSAHVTWRAVTSKEGCRIGPPGWESGYGLLKKVYKYRLCSTIILNFQNNMQKDVSRDRINN
jgi:hypothetical protein